MNDFEEFKKFCLLFLLFYFRKLRDNVSEKIKKSGKEWTGRSGFRDLDEVKTEIGQILKFIRMNSLLTVFRGEGEYRNYGGPLTNLLNFAEENFGLDQLQAWLNVYESKNPLLALLERPNWKKITLAKFLREIQIWERDRNGYPVKDSAGMQKKRNLSGTVKIRRKGQNGNQPIIELENLKAQVILCTTSDVSDKIIQVDDGIPKSLWNILDTLGKTEIVLEMIEIIAIGGQATVIEKELEFDRENGNEKIKTCLKFEEYKNEDREKEEREKHVLINGEEAETGPVFGKGLITHLMNSMEYKCGSEVTHPNIIDILDFGITKTIFGDYFFSQG